MTMKEKIIYKRIKELREDSDYTQDYVGKLLGISQRGYSHYENGDYDIPASLLIKLAKIYKKTTDYILGISDK